MDKDEILSLAKLARLEITETEIEGYKRDFDGILNYIDSIKEVDVSMEDNYETNLTKNYMREDELEYAPGEFTDDILAVAPDTKNGYIKVKKIL